MNPRALRSVLLCLFIFAVMVLGYRMISAAYVTPILMYHHIDANDKVWKLSVTPQNFRRQMEFLKAHKYRVISLYDYVEILKAGKPIPRKSVVITFDDGYDDNIVNAYPVLKSLGFSATIFMELQKLGAEGYMDVEDLKLLAENGIEIGSHTIHHAFVPDLDEEGLKREIRDSKAFLEGILERPVRLFSYPGGGFTAEGREWVIQSGYAGAVATHPGPQYSDRDPYALKRIRISRSSNNLVDFWFRTSGFFTYLEELRG